MALSMVLLILLACYILPIVLIAMSQKTEGFEKLIWIVLTFVFSWLALLAYFIAAPVTKSTREAT